MERTCPRCKAPVDAFLFNCNKCGARVTGGLDIHGIRTDGKADEQRSLDDDLRRLLDSPESLPLAVSEPSAQERVESRQRRRWWRKRK